MKNFILLLALLVPGTLWGAEHFDELACQYPNISVQSIDSSDLAFTITKLSPTTWSFKTSLHVISVAIKSGKDHLKHCLEIFRTWRGHENVRVSVSYGAGHRNSERGRFSASARGSKPTRKAAPGPR